MPNVLANPVDSSLSLVIALKPASAFSLNLLRPLLIKDTAIPIRAKGPKADFKAAPKENAATFILPNTPNAFFPPLVKA